MEMSKVFLEDPEFELDLKDVGLELRVDHYVLSKIIQL